MDTQKLADLLFPDITESREDYERLYPKRELSEGAMVTRLGPSPTGFIHLGNLYGAFVDERLAHGSGGTFYLRIEDTDDKRYVEGAVETIITSLDFFGIQFDEGAVLDTDTGEDVVTDDSGNKGRGAYGPYFQSARGRIYQCFAKELVKNGDAYPCFMTSEEIAEIRAGQEAEKLTPGIYGSFARSRGLSFEEIERRIGDGESYVIRLRSGGDHTGDPENIRQIRVKDGIRGELTMPENDQDIVILKATGIPTYHFAHVIDDYFMRTTHVVRGEEWLSSLPIHIELFEKLGFDVPVYCHTAQLMKLDENGNKRKLSKRKDPELSLDFYREKGYHPLAVREYLLNILNSNFEEWRRDNPDAGISEFDFSLSKMSNSGALFDLNKLDDVSKDVLVRIPADELYTFLKEWAEKYSPIALKQIDGKKDYVSAALDIGRSGKKPRKDLVSASQMFEFISYFFDGSFKIEDELPDEVTGDDCRSILSGYLSTYDHSDDQSAWFEKIRNIAEELGYAAKPKDYKKDPDSYKGHVGHVSTAIRIALTGRSQSPDIWEIQQILGEDKVRQRISAYSAGL